MGGFNLDIKNANGTTGCQRSTQSAVVGKAVVDYIPHHNWFQYFASTANPKHARPRHRSRPIGQDGDPANHEYDLQDFYDAVKAGNFPAVSYIKLDAYQDGHAGYSDPLDEQDGTAALVNFIEQQPDWKSTAIFVTWDDSGRLVRPCLRQAGACVVRPAGGSGERTGQVRRGDARRTASMASR